MLEGADLEEADKRPHMLGKGAEKVPNFFLFFALLYIKWNIVLCFQIQAKYDMTLSYT